MPELDTLRGFAILLAFLYHGLFWTLPQDRLTPSATQFSSLFRGGWIGVQLFFVLSGFLITSGLLDAAGKPRYFRTFYFRRALRILPVFLLLVALLIATGMIGWKFALASIAFTANLSPLLGIAMQYPPLWSLAVEEHFYAFWPLIVHRLAPRTIAIASGALFLASPAIRGFAFAGGFTHNMAFYTWFNIDGLALGALLAVLARTISRRAFTITGAISLLCGIGGAAALIALGQWSRTSLGGSAFLLTALYSIFGGLLALSLIVGSSPRHALVRIPVLQRLGAISYGLYLVHVFCFTTFDRVAGVPSAMTTRFVLLRFALAGGAAIVLASLSRTYFENYFLAMKNRERALLDGALDHQVA